jgi:hypothetical protein
VRNDYKNLVGKHRGKRPLGRPKTRWEDTIEKHIKWGDAMTKSCNRILLERFAQFRNWVAFFTSCCIQ